MVFGRGKAEEQPSRDERDLVPDELVSFIARRLFEDYGEAFAETINRKLSQRFDAIERRLAEHEEVIRYLKASSDDKIKEYMRSILEVHTESVAEKSAVKTVERMGVDRIEVLESRIKELTKIQTEVAEVFENTSKILDDFRKSMDALSKNFADINGKLETILEKQFEAVEKFRDEVAAATREAVKTIRENVVVDRTLIEGVVESVLSRIVASKMESVTSELVGLSDRVQNLEGEVRRLGELFATAEEILKKVEDFERKLADLKFVAVEGLGGEEIKEEEESDEDFLRKELFEEGGS